ncbi:MAG: hypothetical protein II649_00220 [Kiritimatiellae bacterium]|nr:hypothetical protein [Kiritimatiellia bacterium]
MNRILSFFTSNLGLKLLALVLAIIVFYAVRDSMSTTRLYTEQPLFGAPAITEGAD